MFSALYDSNLLYAFLFAFSDYAFSALTLLVGQQESRVESSRPRERPKRTCREVTEKDCQTRKSNRENAMNRSRWRKLIKDS